MDTLPSTHSKNKNRSGLALRSPGVPRSLAAALLKLYDYPHPTKAGVTVKGYDKAHAARTARMCVRVARELGHPPDRLKQFHIACLLHDLGRVGLDPQRFGTIWSWARKQHIPTRPMEWRAAYPATPPGKETEAFLRRYGRELIRQGIVVDAWTKAQIEMRLGFARRLRRQLRSVKPRLRALGIVWAAWMDRIMLYYYYPDTLKHTPTWVHELGEILVACEQLEAYNNSRRGRDYYDRTKESFHEALEFLDRLHDRGLVGRRVWETIRRLTAQGAFTDILGAARGKPLSTRERRQLTSLAAQGIAWPS